MAAGLNRPRKVDKSQETPFYAVPQTVRTSSQIIDEARRSLKTLPIQRPYTPASDGRHLFSTTTSSRGIRGGERARSSERRVISSRPPSVFSMGPGKYSDELSSNQFTSRPTSKQRLSPIENNIEDDSSSSLINITSSHSTTSLPPPSSSSSTPSLVPPPPITTITTTSDDKSGLPVLKTSDTSPSTSRRVKSADKDVHINKKDINKRKTNKKDNNKPTTLTTPPITSHSTAHTKAHLNNIWEKDLLPLLQQLDPSSNDVEHLCTVCPNVWSVLKTHELFGKVLGPKRRNTLLQTIFKMLDHKEPELLLKLAKLILAMQVTGNNLLNVSKLVFSLSREETNDSLFIEEDITGLLLTALSSSHPHSQHETMIYSIGCIKLLASNDTLRQRLTSTENCVHMISQCIEKCMNSEGNKEDSQAENNHKYIANILIQLIGALRNLSDTSDVYDQLINYSLIESLASVMERYIDNNELIFNLSRLLSKLTLSDQCRSIVCSTSLYLSLLPTALNKHIKNEEIVLRITFILGNISRDSTDISHTLSHSSPLIPTLSNVLTLYSTGTTVQEITAKTIDVLIKCISLLANLSVHQSIAVTINSNNEMISSLLNILELFSSNEELTVNTLAALNNLSFYSQEGILLHQSRIIDILVDFLSPNSHSIMLESTRVLGNLTRQPTVRTIISTNRVDELLITLLDSKHSELVYAVCGVLVNLMMDERGESIGVLRKNNGVKKLELLDVLSHYGRQDWLLSSLVCKVLWNYSRGLPVVCDSFSNEEIVSMYHLLEEYLDPVTAFTNLMIDEEEEREEEDSSLNSTTQQFWESDFVPVASDIIQRLRQYSQHNQIPIT